VAVSRRSPQMHGDFSNQCLKEILQELQISALWVRGWAEVRALYEVPLRSTCNAGIVSQGDCLLAALDLP
jgi:hypothetical protein